MVGRLLSFWVSAYFQVTTIDGRHAPPGMYKTIVNPGVNCKLPFPQLGELDPEFWSINVVCSFQVDDSCPNFYPLQLDPGLPNASSSPCPTSSHTQPQHLALPVPQPTWWRRDQEKSAMNDDVRRGEVLWCFSGIFGKSEGYQFPNKCFLQEGRTYILRLWNLTFMEIASLSNNYS